MFPPFDVVLYSFAAVVLIISIVIVFSNRILRRQCKVPKPGSAIFITGCSSGIGRAAAEHFIRKGYVVFATVRKDTDSTALTEALGSTKSCVPVLCDVAKETDVANAKSFVESELRKRGIQIGAVINNAGVFVYEREKLSTKSLETSLGVNVVAPYRVVETFLPLLRESNGRIINIGSYFGSFAAATYAVAYATTKFAVEGMTDGMRRRYGPEGISVSLVKPGNIKTNMAGDYGESSCDVVNAALEHALTSRYPMPRYWPGTVKGHSCKTLCRMFQILPEVFADKMLGGV